MSRLTGGHLCVYWSRRPILVYCYGEEFVKVLMQDYGLLNHRSDSFWPGSEKMSVLRLSVSAHLEREIGLESDCSSLNFSRHQERPQLDHCICNKFYRNCTERAKEDQVFETGKRRLNLIINFKVAVP